MNYDNQNDAVVSENVLAGIVGAFLFSLTGGVVWFIFNYVNIYSPIAGLIGVIMAIKGYQLFAKKESIKGIIIASIVAFSVLVLAWYLCFGIDIYEAYQQWYENGEIDFTLSYHECLRIVPNFLAEPEIGPSYIKDLAIGLGFALVGSIGTIINEVRNIKDKKRLLESGNNSQKTEESPEENQEDSMPLRSAYMDEKVRVYLKEKAFGHEIIFRKVAKLREELVIDGMVYAEYVLVSRIQMPYEMHASLDGHYFEAGCRIGCGNYISVDRVVIAKRIRW